MIISRSMKERGLSSTVAVCIKKLVFFQIPLLATRTGRKSYMVLSVWNLVGSQCLEQSGI